MCYGYEDLETTKPLKNYNLKYIKMLIYLKHRKKRCYCGQCGRMIADYFKYLEEYQNKFGTNILWQCGITNRNFKVMENISHLDFNC